MLLALRLMSPPTPSSTSRRTSTPVAVALISLGLTVALACRPDATGPPPAPRSSPGLSPISADDLAHLRGASTIYWRHSRTSQAAGVTGNAGDAGDAEETGEAACEPWTLRWTDEASTRAVLERELPSPPTTTLRFDLTLVDEHLHARHPQIERSGELRMLPCAFAGRLELEDRIAKSLELAGPVSWFLDAEACASDDPSSRIRPLGCPSVLADLRSREHLVDPPQGSPTIPAWLDDRRIFLRLERADGPSQCLALRRHDGPQGAHHGLLNGRVDDWTIELSYHFDGSWLTLSGPTWRRRHGRDETVVSRGCLLSEPVLEDIKNRGHFARVGWFGSRRECAEATMDELAPRCLTDPPAPSTSARDGSGR